MVLRYHLLGCAILAAASELGSPTLYSEDLNHGQTYESIQVINPFL